VIPMERVLDEIDFLVGDKFNNVDELLNQQSFEVFSDKVVSLLSEISDNLFKFPKIREFPDVATFAFYCRKANLNSIKKEYVNENSLHFGKGIVFHIAPSNVPVNFAYSLFAGLIAGNINIVRVPSKNFEQVDIIVNVIKNVINKQNFFSLFSKRIYLIRYNRDSIATEYFSGFCDIRVIWGGDNTINEIRKSKILPKSTDITFSDRYSIAIIKAQSYLEYVNKIKVAYDFYNDTYLFDQNACTSPQIIYWLGSNEDILKAQAIFWDKLKDILIEKKFELQPILSINKLTTFFTQAICQDNIVRDLQSTNSIWRVKNLSVEKNIELYKCGSGYFNESSISSLDELIPVINRKFQTIGYFGFEKQELSSWVKKSRILGVDRVVQIGKTMDFSMTWDGYDLISSLSRKIIIS
jgi:hypothetical protein